MTLLADMYTESISAQSYFNRCYHSETKHYKQHSISSSNERPGIHTDPKYVNGHIIVELIE
jgi:hypothetical protein